MLAKRVFFVSAALLCLALTYHVGARRAGAAATTTLQEVAVLSGQIANGGTIPLPHYQDGTEALESECRWTVSIAQVLGIENTTISSARIECSTQGRIVHAFTCVQGDCGSGLDPRSATANYFIVAIRNESPTPAQQSTFGSVKVRYR